MARTALTLARTEIPDRGDPIAEARRVVGEAAPVLAERLVRIATDDRHPRQLDAIKLGLAYVLGQPTVRVEARVERAPIDPEMWAKLRDALRDATAKMGPLPDVEASLVSGVEAIPTAEGIAAVTRQLGAGRPKPPGSA